MPVPMPYVTLFRLVVTIDKYQRPSKNIVLQLRAKIEPQFIYIIYLNNRFLNL